jgi:hypothetical protein
MEQLNKKKVLYQFPHSKVTFLLQVALSVFFCEDAAAPLQMHAIVDIPLKLAAIFQHNCTLEKVLLRHFQIYYIKK